MPAPAFSVGGFAAEAGAAGAYLAGPAGGRGPAASDRSRPASTAVVALASASARWHGPVLAEKWLASVASLWSCTSGGPSSILDKTAVSITGPPGHSIPQRWHASVRKATSNGALWATSTAPAAKARNCGSTAPIGGAWPTMASVIPVSDVIAGGMGACGLTSAENSLAGAPGLSLIAPISVMAAESASQPVVSTSTTIRSARGRNGATGSSPGSKSQ